MSTNTQTQLQAAPQCPYWRLETAGGTLLASLLGMRRGQIWREAVRESLLLLGGYLLGS